MDEFTITDHCRFGSELKKYCVSSFFLQREHLVKTDNVSVHVIPPSLPPVNLSTLAGAKVKEMNEENVLCPLKPIASKFKSALHLVKQTNIHRPHLNIAHVIMYYLRSELAYVACW